jgi:hypothetical protein
MKMKHVCLILLVALLAVGLRCQLFAGVDSATYFSSGIIISCPTNSTHSPGSLTVSVLVTGLSGSNVVYSMAYSIDGMENVTVPLVTQGHEGPFQIAISGSATVPKLVEGTHSITVYEKIQINTSPPKTLWDNSTVYFTVDDGIPPIATVLSLENKTYSQTDLPLIFTEDQPCSWSVYCLDGAGNVTVAGNTTLTNLAYTPHNVTVYVRDLAGNTGSSGTISFSVSQPEKRSNFFQTPTIAVALGAAAVIVGLMVYFKRHKPKPANVQKP